MYSKTATRASALVGHERRWMRSFLIVAWKLSSTALSKQLPVAPIETSIPTARQRRVKISDVYWADSTGRGNTSMGGGCDGQAGGVDEGVDGPVADEVAGRAVAAARCRASVLAADRGGLEQRGGGAGSRGVAGGWHPMVPRAWRHGDVHA